MGEVGLRGRPPRGRSDRPLAPRRPLCRLDAGVPPDRGRARARPAPARAHGRRGPAAGAGIRGREPRAARRPLNLGARGPYFFMSLSKATLDGEKFMVRTNSSASLAPNSRSMPLSSHSTESGPVVAGGVELADDGVEVDVAVAERAEVPAAPQVAEGQVRAEDAGPAVEASRATSFMWTW
ncbi:MAG: hypothetical protein MZV64_33810 [Ignavibacteriales bacterium]|nr:hypothetical protein [Ignavibacteriales bacterium]